MRPGFYINALAITYLLQYVSGSTSGPGSTINEVSPRMAPRRRSKPLPHRVMIPILASRRNIESRQPLLQITSRILQLGPFFFLD